MQEDQLEEHFAMLEQLADNYAEGSPENSALLVAAQALAYLKRSEVETKFQEWVRSWKSPPTALQVLYAKLMGVDDFPHDLLDDSMKEVEQLMERLKRLRS
jgi:hypothetical protein